MDAEVELREVEAERPRAGAEVGEAAVGDPLSPVGPEQRIELVEIRHQLRAVRIAVGSEPLPDRDEHGAERLVGVADLGHRADHRRRHPPRRPEVPQLRSVEVPRELAGALERVRDRLGADVRVAVEVAPDPAAERSASPAPSSRPTSARSSSGIAFQKLCSKNHSPCRISSTTRGRLERISSVCQSSVISSARPVLDPPALRGRRALVIEAGEERGDPAVRLEHGAARRLGRMGGEDELDPEPRAGRLERGSSTPRGRAARTHRRATPRHPPLGLVLTAPADPVVLLGDVDELEEQRERTQDGPLALEAERRDRRAERVRGPPARASRARARIRSSSSRRSWPLLLDEHPPEQVAEQAHVGTERAVGRHAASA